MSLRIQILIILSILMYGCYNPTEKNGSNPSIQEPDYIISAEEKNHYKFSSLIPPVISVPSGAVVEAFAQEATGGQLRMNSTIDDYLNVDWDKVHVLAGPIYVEGAEAGDMLAVELLDLEPGEWGWTGLDPTFGFLAGEHDASLFKTYELDKVNNLVHFSDSVSIPLKPFPGVMGVAPDTTAMLSTHPPRANGGNMDDPNMIKGVTVYFPVFVEGALFSIGDPHAIQGHGEVCGTAVECPMRIRFRLSVIKGRTISEPQYESDEYYATTGFAPTIDEAAKKATRYMVEHISRTYNMSWVEAYMLCSLIGDLKIAEVVDLPNMLVTMHIPKGAFNTNGEPAHNIR